jgi:hypothetical protein
MLASMLSAMLKMAANMTNSLAKTRLEQQLSRTHIALGLAGLIPFVGLAIARQVTDLPALWQLGYASLIFSFLGGILWSQSLKRSAPKHTSWVAIAVMLWAWCWLIFDSFNWLLPAGLSFIVLWLYERRYLSDLYPQGFIKLRCLLSMIAATSLCLSAV